MTELTRLERRLHQQEVVATLGQEALDTDDIDQLMRDTCEAVSETLNNEFTKVLELLPGGDAVFLRQGVGWRTGLVGTATIPTDLDSQAGYTLISEEPVIVDDLQTESRFSGPDLLTNHDVTSGISVIIGSVDEPWGVFGTHTTERRNFTDFDAAFVQSVANVLASAIERKQHQRQLERASRRTELALTATEATVWEWNYEDDSVITHPDPHGLFHTTVRTGDEYREPIVPADRKKIDRAVQDAMEGESPFHVEYRYRLEGNVKWAEDYAEIFDAVDGNGPRMIGVAYDISERKERELELERFKRAVEASGYAIYMTNPRGEVTYVNPAFETITGYGPDEAIGKTPSILHPEDEDDVHRERWEAIRAGDVWEEEITDSRKDGSTYHARQTIAPVTGPDGSIDRLVGILHDITERKQRQQALAESERRYRALVDHFPKGAVALFDDELCYTAAGGELLKKWDADDPVGQKVVERYPDAIVKEVEPHFRAALDGEKREFEVEYHDRHLLASTLPIRTDDGAVHGGMLVVLDVTDERESERRLKASHRRLEEFASAVSHDLREPLSTVASYLQLLERRYENDLDEDAKDFIHFAVDGATRMQEMIDGIVSTYATVESAGNSFEAVDLDAVVDDVLHDFDEKIERSDAEVSVEPLPTVVGDGSQLRQLFMNFIDNAIKYSGEERPRVHISASSEGDGWRVSVADEGIGMKPEATGRVFDVFSRAHPDQGYPGTGIGLALCDRIVNRHGGNIGVESTPGEGSTFWFTLPDAPSGVGETEEI